MSASAVKFKKLMWSALAVVVVMIAIASFAVVSHVGAERLRTAAATPPKATRVADGSLDQSLIGQLNEQASLCGDKLAKIEPVWDPSVYDRLDKVGFLLPKDAASFCAN
jgi:hypothetical protein